MRAKISLTPLIDIVFILLVFLMLASNFDDRRQFELKSGGPSGNGPTDVEPLLVEVTQQGWLLGGREMDRAALGEQLQTRLGRGDALRILLMPDDTATTQRLVDSFDLMSALGISDVVLVQGSQP